MRVIPPCARGAVALAAVLLALACGPTELAEPPPELLGVWKTRAHRHARNFLEIRRDDFVLGVSGLVLEVRPIRKIERSRQSGGNALYRLHFAAPEGYDDVLALTWLERERALRVGSAEGTWTRSSSR